VSDLLRLTLGFVQAGRAVTFNPWVCRFLPKGLDPPRLPFVVPFFPPFSERVEHSFSFTSAGRPIPPILSEFFSRPLSVRPVQWLLVFPVLGRLCVMMKNIFDVEVPFYTFFFFLFFFFCLQTPEGSILLTVNTHAVS